jgi:hypothetical protein
MIIIDIDHRSSAPHDGAGSPAAARADASAATARPAAAQKGYVPLPVGALVTMGPFELVQPLHFWTPFVCTVPLPVCVNQHVIQRID